MTSIIINSFYRALTRINDYTPIKDLDLKKLATLLMDELYPEDGYVTLEDNPRGNFRIHMNDQFMDRMRAEVGKGLSVAEAIETTGLKEEPVAPAVPEPAPAAPAPAVKEVKVKQPKMTKEEKEAAKEAAKAAKAAEKAAAKEAEKAAKAAEKAAAKAAPKTKFVNNLEKLNPTQEKTWKKVAAEAKVTLTEEHKTQFIAAMNALDNKVYNAKKMEVHMAEFFAPKEEPKTKDEECWPVEFNGKDYWVNKEGVVYETITLENGTEINKKVGNVGLAAFKDMKQPTD